MVKTKFKIEEKYSEQRRRKKKQTKKQTKLNENKLKTIQNKNEHAACTAYCLGRSAKKKKSFCLNNTVSTLQWPTNMMSITTTILMMRTHTTNNMLKEKKKKKNNRLC